MVRRATIGYAILVGVILTLNLLTLVAAYPETTGLDSGCCAPGSGPLARDFSAYYVGSWRLFHDPSAVYSKGYIPDGEPFVAPQPEQYKYLPSFLLLVSPLLLLQYQTALTAFDVFQFMLLPLVALMLYRMTSEKGTLTSSLVAVVVLLLPLPVPGWGASAIYFWQWAEGQAKVLLTFLLVLSLYFAREGRPAKAGVALGLASFDPRFALLAAPLFLVYNRNEAKRAWGSFVVVLGVANSVLLVPGVASGFLQMLLGGGVLTPLYYYAWIPVAAAVSLTVAEWKQVVEVFVRKTCARKTNENQGAGWEGRSRRGHRML